MPPAEYSSVAWLDADTLLLDWMPPALPDGRSQGTRLVSLDLGAAEHRELPHRVSDDTCDFIEESAPVALADGRVAFLRDCVLRNGGPIDQIGSIDLATGSEDLLAELGAPTVAEGWTAQVGSFSFRPDATDGIVGFGARICDGMAAFDDRGMRPFEFALVDPQGANLADTWIKDCVDTVNAREPAWSPDGRHMAVLVAPGTLRREGFGRLSADYDLLILNPSDGSSVRIASGLRGAFRLNWSTDGSTIAVIGEAADGSDRTATWLVATDGTGARPLVLNGGGSLSDIAWSPDGSRLAGLLASPDDEALDTPVLITLSTLAEVPVAAH